MSQLKVSEEWLRGLTAEERQEMKLLVVNSEKLLDKLKKIVYNMCTKKEEVSLDNYDTPSWAYRQAHQNGEAAAYRKILSMLTIIEREDQHV